MSKNMSPEEVKDLAREYLKLTQTNVVKVAGTIVSNYKGEAKVKTNKEGMVLLDPSGEPLTYAPRCKVKVAFTGGEIEIPVSLEQFNKISVGGNYLFTGRLGLVKDFGSESVSFVFDLVEEL